MGDKTTKTDLTKELLKSCFTAKGFWILDFDHVSIPNK